MNITPKAFDALVILLRAAPNPAEAEQMRLALWPDIIVEENALANLIYQLRRTLAVNGGSTTYIRTIPKFGYAMSVMVSCEADIDAPAVPANGGTSQARDTGRRSWVTMAGIISILLIASFAGGKAWTVFSNRREAEGLAREALQLIRLRDAKRSTDASNKLRLALLRDPSNPLAHAALAEFSARNANAALGYARQLAERAVQLDPSCAECRAILGWVAMVREWDWPTAARELDEAIRLESSNVRAHLWRAQLLMAKGALAEARREIDWAAGVQPGDDAVLTMRAGILYGLGDFTGAAAEARRAAAINPASAGPFDWLYRAEFLRGRKREALHARMQAVCRAMGLSADTEFAMQHELKALYDEGGAEHILREWLNASSAGPILHDFRYERATWKMWIGDRDGAIEELHAAAEARTILLIYVAVDPVFAPLRDDSRFQALLKELNLTRRDG